MARKSKKAVEDDAILDSLLTEGLRLGKALIDKHREGIGNFQESNDGLVKVVLSITVDETEATPGVKTGLSYKVTQKCADSLSSKLDSAQGKFVEILEASEETED